MERSLRWHDLKVNVFEAELHLSHEYAFELLNDLVMVVAEAFECLR